MLVTRTLLFTAILLLALTAAAAQSGRRVAAAPTPAPKAADDPSEYSESKALPKRPRLGNSSLRNVTVSPTQAAANAKPEEPVSGDENTILKVQTDLVTIPVSVYDRNGLYIPALRRSDFTIYENGVKQNIEYFGTSEKPFTVVLLIDTSPSTDYKIGEIRDAAKTFVDLLKPSDQVAVIEFDGNVHVLSEVTHDRNVLYKAIGKADFGGGTSLYTAVNFTITKTLAGIEGRKAVVLFTDGVDTTSARKHSYDSTLDLAEESDVIFFPIYYNTFLGMQQQGQIGFPGGMGGMVVAPGSTMAEYAVGKKYLEDLAAYTGGKLYRPEATPGGLSAAFEGIAEELRDQYAIGYSPTEDGKPGERREIKVRVNRPDVIVQARDSYIVGATK